MNGILGSLPPRVFSAVFPAADEMERGLRRDKVKYAWECNLTVRAERKRNIRGYREGGMLFCDNSVIIETKHRRDLMRGI